MLLKAINKTLIEGQPKTYLTAAASAAGTSLTVKNNSGFITDNLYIMIGEPGQEKTEIMQNNSYTTVGTSITIDREGGAGGLRFDHDIDTPIYVIDYNQVEFSHAATAAGSKSVIQAATAVTPDSEFSRYEDTSNTTGFGFVRFKNATSGSFSVYSVAIPYTGYTANMLRSIRKKVRRLLDEPDDDRVTDDEITEEINMAQTEVAHERLWSFYEKTKSFSSVANQYKYTLATDCYRLYDSNFDTQPLGVRSMRWWNLQRWDTDVSSDPTDITIWRNEAYVYPYPSDSADTTAIDDASDITASDTTITVDSTSSFQSQGRIIIDSEVIIYTGTTSTTFTGCTRGAEGTTAATHLDNATVTERDFLYHFQEEPADLDDETDTTEITEPSILAYKASMELCDPDNDKLYKKLERKFDRRMHQLKKVDAPKTRAKALVVRSATVRKDVINPNDYPQDINL